jgi:hypothetical protein
MNDVVVTNAGAAVARTATQTNSVLVGDRFFETVAISGVEHVLFKPLACTLGWSIELIGGGVARVRSQSRNYVLDFEVQDNVGYVPVNQVFEMVSLESQ